ncbi:MAG: OsmC family protein [Candidatus Thermoplasmatota archaeon]|nr:OsmC family protein [Candidatus Thermoplasmatota archaeon]
MEEQETREVHLKREGNLAEVKVRDFELLIDEPVDKGGTNKGPRPTEYLLAALVGCYTATFVRIAEKRKQHIERIECTAREYISRKENRATKAELSLVVYSSMSDEELGIINRLAENSCTVKNSLNTEVITSVVRA